MKTNGTRKAMAVTALSALTLLLVAGAPPARATTITVDFDALDATGGPVSGATLDTYLAGFGVTITDVVDPIINTVFVVQGEDDGLAPILNDAEVAASSPNFLTQATGGATSRSYRLVFDTPLDSLSFTRVGYYGLTGSGIIYPAWSVKAFDAGAGLLGTASELATGSFAPFPGVAPKTFTFSTPGIKSVRVTGDHLGFAGRAQVGIDNLVLTFTAVPEPTTGALLALGLAGIGFSRRRR